MEFESYYPDGKTFNLKDYDAWTQTPGCNISHVAKQQFEDFRDILDHSTLRRHEILYGMQMALGEMILDYTPDACLPFSYDDGSNWRYMHHCINKVFMTVI